MYRTIIQNIKTVFNRYFELELTHTVAHLMKNFNLMYYDRLWVYFHLIYITRLEREKSKAVFYEKLKF